MTHTQTDRREGRNSFIDYSSVGEHGDFLRDNNKGFWFFLPKICYTQGF